MEPHPNHDQEDRSSDVHQESFGDLRYSLAKFVTGHISILSYARWVSQPEAVSSMFLFIVAPPS